MFVSLSIALALLALTPAAHAEEVLTPKEACDAEGGTLVDTLQWQVNTDHNQTACDNAVAILMGGGSVSPSYVNKVCAALKQVTVAVCVVPEEIETPDPDDDDDDDPVDGPTLP